MIKVLASGSKGNCYILEAEEETLLLECGIQWRQILKGLNFNIKNVVGCLVTHSHKDHSLSAKKAVENGIDIYTSKQTHEEIGTNLSYRARYLTIENTVQIGSFKILPLKANHTNTDETECTTLAFLINHPNLGKILFATDTYYLKYRFKDIDHILIECNYSEDILQDLKAYQARLFKSHMSLETLKDFLKSSDLAKTKDITLIHISENNGDSEKFKEEIERLTGIPTYIATPGLEIV